MSGHDKKNAQKVIGAHRRTCARYQAKVRANTPVVGEAGGGPFDGCAMAAFDSDEETGPQFIEAEDHEDFQVNVFRTSAGKTAAEKNAYRERMRALDALSGIEEGYGIPRRDLGDLQRRHVWEEQREGEDGQAEAAGVLEEYGVEIDNGNPVFSREGASSKILLHQREVQKKMLSPLPDMRCGKDPKSTIDLYSLGMTLNLSRRQGKELLEFLKEHGNGPFYESWGGLQTAFDKQFKTICVLNRLEIELPSDFFGEQEPGGATLKKTVCEYFDILSRIGDAFLEIKPEDFSRSFSVDVVKDSEERIYSTYPKARLFQRITIWTQSTHGEEAVPVAVAIYYDKAQATSSRSACPLIMFILNCTGESFKPIFLGYCPIRLPYSDEYLTKVLTRRGVGDRVPSKASCKYAIRFAKRQALQKFLVHVLKPLIDCDTGFLVQLGASWMYPEGTDPEVIFAVGHVSHIIGDSEALHDIGSVKLLAKKCRCRQCRCCNLNVFGPDNRSFPVRDSKEMYALTSYLGEYELFKFRNSCGLLTAAERKISKEERARRKTIRRHGKLKGVIPGENTVILLWEKLEKAGILPFYRALTIDILHTIWKGILEAAAGCTLQLVHCVSLNYLQLDLAVKYRDAMANLDHRVASFPGGKESLQPFPFVHLDRVSDLLKETSKKAKAQSRTTGLFTGSFPAWQMRNLCLQLVFGIGWEGSILPNEDIVFGKEKQRRGNPTTLCINALLGVLWVAAYCEARELTESQLEKMSWYIDNASCRLLQLYDFKQQVCLKVGYIRRSDKRPAMPREMPSNFKTHAMSHLVKQFRNMGDWSAYDASSGEKYHQVSVSGAFKRSSGVIETTQQEMAVHVVRKQFVKMQKEYISGPVAERLEEDEEDLEQDFRFQQFHAVPSLGSVVLVPAVDDAMLCTNPPGEIQFLHPLLDPDELHRLIGGVDESHEFVTEVFHGFSRCQPQYSIRLFGGVKSDGDKKAGLEPWYLRANREYHGNFRGRTSRQGIPAFNSFQLDYSASPEAEDRVDSFAKVLALVGFQKLELTPKRHVVKTEIWVACARYEQTAHPTSGAPFDQYVFEQSRGRLSIDLVPLDSIKRPCFMCVSCDARISHRFETKHNYKDMTWSCIPFNCFNKVLNVAMATVVREESEEVEHSPLASAEELTEVLAEFSLQGKHSASELTHEELRAMFPASRREARGGGGGGGGGDSRSDTDSDSGSDIDSHDSDDDSDDDSDGDSGS